MKICFISPQTPYLENITSPPLNLLYLNSYLRLHGYNDTKIVDLNVEKNNAIPESDVYAISATTTQFPYALDLLKDLGYSGTKIIGGPHATALSDDCREFDKVIVGDGELALLHCLSDIKNEAKRHIYIGEQVSNIDNLPMPNRYDIDINKYNYYIDDKFSTIALTMRGCYFACHFCQKMTKGVRFHGTKYVLKELQHLIDCGYDGVDLQDNVFTMRNDLLEIGNFLKTKKMTWRCQIRPDEKIKNIESLEKMGCKHVLSGIESGSQKILDIVNKKIDIKKVPNLVKDCKSRGIEFRALMIIGLPGETHETVNDTIDFLREIDCESVGVGTFVPYPGTYIYNHLDKFDLKIEEPDYRKWFFRTRKGEYNCIVSTSGLTSDEILYYRNEIDREFNKT